MPLDVISTNLLTGFVVQSGSNVLVSQGATLSGLLSGVFNLIPGAQNDISLTVQGTIHATTGIDLFSNATATNDAYLYVGIGGLVLGTDIGISLQDGDDNVVVNNGEISGQNGAINSGGGEISVHNNGSISAFGATATGAILFGATAEGSDIREVVNTGIISGAPQIAGGTNATISNISGAEFHLSNSGTILSVGSTAIYASAGVNSIDNSELIVGDIITATVTELTNSGTIDGEVILSLADDTYQGVADGVVTGLLDLGLGNDFATIGDSGSEVCGGMGADTILGGGGSDDLCGDAGNDSIRGRTNDDIIDGGSGDDTLRGGQGDDEVYGGLGDDFIRGGDGDDIIVGGEGSDTMFGNEGADTFVFDAISDSPDSSGRDLIQDFESGVDVIDLSAFSDLTFVGDAAFSGTGAEIRVTTPATGKTKIFVDVDGDGEADMKIILSGAPAFVEDDFLL